MSKHLLLENIYEAYYEARKNKRNTKEQLLFELGHERELHVLWEAICNRTYTVSTSTVFVIEKPVYREVFAPQFIDRIVHHLIASYIRSPMELGLIQDAYSCRRGKGTAYGIKRVGYFMRSATANYAKDAYILKLDLSGYFMNINRSILYQQIKKMQLVEQINGSDFEKESIDYLIKQVIYSSATANCSIKGDKGLWKFIPNNKSLFHSPDNCGLPIGNLTSQLFGNIYLNEFDHWVKQELGIKYYGRYVDDMVFMHQDRDYLKQCMQSISSKLASYGVEVHPKKIYFQHYTKGVAFLGQYIKPYRSYISNRTKNNFYTLLKEIKECCDKDAQVDLDILFSMRARINSYWGVFIKANSYTLLKNAMISLPSGFYDYFYFEKYKNSWKCKLKPLHKLNLNGAIL